MPVDVKIVLDVSHARMYEDPFISVDHGMTYDYTNSSCFVDPINRVCMCKPLPVTNAWRTTTSGLYKRKRKTDFSGLVSADWAETTLQVAGNWYLKYQGTATSHARYLTTETYAANPSMYVAFGSYNSGNERVKVWEFGFMGPYSSTNPVLQFDIWSNGRVAVYRYGVLIKKGSLGSFRGAKPNTTSEVADYSESATDMPEETNVADMPSERNFIDMLILTGMENELLVLTNSGEGFDVEFDLAEGEDLIPAGSKFYFRPYEGEATLQVANCNFEPTATIFTKPSIAEAPMSANRPYGTEYFASKAAKDGSSYGTIDTALYNTDFSGVWTPDGASDQFRTRITLSTNATQTRTPFLYANMTSVGGRMVKTPNQPFDLTPYVKNWTLKVTGDGNYSKLTCNIINTRGFELEFGKMNEMVPVALFINNIPIFVGALVAYSFINEGHQPNLTTGVMEFLDSSFMLSNQMLSDNIPIDGLYVEEAFRRLNEAFSYIKLDPNILLLDRNGGRYTIDARSTPSKGDFAFKLERGETPAEGIDKLAKIFLIGGLWYIFPQYDPEDHTYREIFYAYTRYQIPRYRRPIKKLYRSIDQVKKINTPLGETVTLGDYYLRVTLDLLPSVANRIVITGRSGRNSDAPAQAVKNDYASQWPGWARADRPNNWKGMVAKYGHYKSELVGQDIINECGEIVYDELTQRKVRMSVETFEPVMAGSNDEIKTPYWLGDRLWVEGWGTMLIRELEMNGLHFPNNDDPEHPTAICEIRSHYGGDRIAPPEEGEVAFDSDE